MSTNPNDPRVLERIRRMSGEERVRLGAGLYEMAKHIVEGGVRREHPDWGDEQVRMEVRRRFDRSRQLYV